MTMYTRRQLVQGAGAVGLGLLAGCGRWPGQAPPAQVARVGMLLSDPANAWVVRNREAFRAGLAELGYVEGQNITLEFRYRIPGESQPAQAVELARLPVDIIVTTGDPSMAAAKQATDTIPIVFALNSAPVEAGIVASLARPGGQATGLSEMTPELSGKRLELLRDTVPGLTRVAVMWSPQYPGPALQFRDAEIAARALGLELVPLPVEGPTDFDAAFKAAVQGRAEGLAVLPGAVTHGNPGPIIAFAAATGLPAVYGDRLYVEAGGLMSYGANVASMHRRAAYYVDRILKGAKPADLPVEQPREFEFVINFRTAEALGLTIPHHVLLQATEVIQ
jgi:putative tryptophan/tyrosine transport system substrate-binding protein